jgi:hypothetical protein
MTWKTCAAAVREAAGRPLTDDQVADIFERAQLRERAIKASGLMDDFDAKLREAIKADADAVRVKAALAKKHAALSVIARDRMTRKALGLVNGGMSHKAAVLAIFEGTTRGLEGGRGGVYQLRLAYEARFVGEMMARIVREVPHAERMLGDRRFLDDVVREMAELRPEGQPGRTNNADAVKVARIFADAGEDSRQVLNKLGANIGKLEGRAGAQTHNPDALAKLGKSEWVGTILPRLDLERSFPDVAPKDVPRILGNVWENIVYSPERLAAKADAAGSGFRGTRNEANALETKRVLHFKSADDWLAYNADYGEGHIFDGMIAQQNRAAMVAAYMEQLGPNPGATMQAVLENLRRSVDADDRIPPGEKAAVKASLTDDTRSAIGKAMSIASGDAMIARNEMAADIGSTIRAAQTLAKLGGAAVSAISDLAVTVHNLRFNGLSFHEAVGGQVREFLRGRGRAEQRELAYLLGEGFDGMIGHITSPFVAADAAPGMAQRMTVRMFRWTGLSLWTDANRAGVARVLSAHLGRQAGKSFDALEPALQNVFRQHGIAPEVWDKLRAEGVRTIDGRPYLTPESVRDDAAAMTLRRYFADEAQSSVLEADARTQRYMTQGTQRGTFLGEALRFLTQFKGYPLTYTHRTLGRAIHGGAEGRSIGAGNIAALIASTTILGYAAMTAKDYLRGYGAREVVGEDGVPNANTILAAMLQGGGAGLFGDFLFANVSRTGNTFLANLAGPTISGAASGLNTALLAARGENVGGQAVRDVVSNFPFMNMWFLRPVLNYMILNDIREALSPGSLARDDIRARQEFGQEPLLSPSDRMLLDIF